METGKVEYAPDYKSKAARLAIEVDRKLRPSLYVNFEKQQQDAAINTEHQRLRSAVVSAAQVVTETYKEKSTYNIVALERLLTTTDALIAFEAEHDIK